jgi:hypothetical protein
MEFKKLFVSSWWKFSIVEIVRMDETNIKGQSKTRKELLCDMKMYRQLLLNSYVSKTCFFQQIYHTCSSEINILYEKDFIAADWESESVYIIFFVCWLISEKKLPRILQRILEFVEVYIILCYA